MLWNLNRFSLKNYEIMLKHAGIFESKISVKGVLESAFTERGVIEVRNKEQR